MSCVDFPVVEGPRGVSYYINKNVALLIKKCLAL
jgi:hypothetical protein